MVAHPGRLVAIAALTLLLAGLPRVEGAEKRPPDMPSAAEIKTLVEREPLTVETWPTWKGRLLAWITDTSDDSQPAFDAARDFMKRQAEMTGGELPAALADDAFAWYMLGSAYLFSDGPADAPAAAKAFRRSLELDGRFAQAHRNLAIAILAQPGEPDEPRLAEAARELTEAKQLDPTLDLAFFQARVALLRREFEGAEKLFQQARREIPDEMAPVYGLAQAIAFNPARAGGHARDVQRLVDEYPAEGPLRCLYAVAFAQDNKWRAAAAELARARELGVDPAQVLGPDDVKRIEKEGAPSILEPIGWVFAAFAAAYAAIMACMAGSGLVFGYFTRGTRALGLLGPAAPLVRVGQVARTSGESWLAKLYMLFLMLGLVLFYVAIPFVLVGLAVGTVAIIWLIFLMGHIPVKLVLLLPFIALAMMWAVIKSLFASAGQGGFGIVKTAAELPRLHEAIGEVAARVETPPADEVYIGPGSNIGVHQEGRGPFGIFGVKRRVLTLGLSGMHVLTLDELKAILAHEFAHFSHGDTFYSRFIYRVTLSIEEALGGMAAAGGQLNYVNPFFWFLVLYHKAYSLMSAGFSRSREFLADRMAASLYGSDVFTSALTKVATYGAFFEATIYNNIAAMLQQDQAFVNMYDAFQKFQESEEAAGEREKLYDNLLNEKTSVYASHPSYNERVEALEGLPTADTRSQAVAIELFEDPEEIEKELTDFLTGYMHLMRQLEINQAAAAEA